MLTLLGRGAHFENHCARASNAGIAVLDRCLQRPAGEAGWWHWRGPWLAEKHVPREKKTAAIQPQPVVAVWECGMRVTRFSAWSGKTANLKKFFISNVFIFIRPHWSEKTHLLPSWGQGVFSL